MAYDRCRERGAGEFWGATKLWLSVRGHSQLGIFQNR
jgi:hypothetical protein